MKNKFYTFIAQLFSGIFHPLLIPTIAYWIILNFLPGAGVYNSKIEMLLLGIVFVTTCVLPIVFILILSLRPDFDRKMMNHRDRIMPFLFTAFSTFLGAQLIGKLPIPHVFRTFLLGMCIVLIVLFLITMQWKISAHTASIGGLIGVLFGLTFKYGINLTFPIIIFVLIAGIIGSVRIYLGKHSPAQVYSGFAIGLAMMYSVIYFF